MMKVPEHAAERMITRGMSIDTVEGVLANAPFQYFHQGAWKTGYYDSASRLFIGSVDGTVTTVIEKATPSYIRNLQFLTPK